MIRRARTEDAEALAALQVRAWRAAYSSYVSAEELAAGEQRLREQGFGAATLWVFVANDVARCFYERHGRRVDERPHDPDRWGWAPSVRYRKAL